MIIMTKPSEALENYPTGSDLSLVNQQYITEILYSQRAGKGCLPHHLGLTEMEFQQLLNHYWGGQKNFALTPVANYWENHNTRIELLELRQHECQELLMLLTESANNDNVSEKWLAKIITAACMGGDHLWRDLGLPNRQSLRDLFMNNFAVLAEKNTGDMRWKKFLYRQLCEQGGHFVCRSPSCETCSTYEECFGVEE